MASEGGREDFTLSFPVFHSIFSISRALFWTYLHFFHNMLTLLQDIAYTQFLVCSPPVSRRSTPGRIKAT